VSDIIIATTGDVAGYRTVRTLGEVFAVTVRSRNMAASVGAGLKSLAAGELKGVSKVLTASRGEAVERMLEQARSKGANAVLGMRFDASEMGDIFTEVCAYGTAVIIAPASDD
jgi:uncharacterized protein YbjQ (UPF0145 family)